MDMDQDLLAITQHALDSVSSKLEVLVTCETLTAPEIEDRELLVGVYFGLHARFDVVFGLYTTSINNININ